MKNENFEYALKMGHLNMVKNNLGDALTARNARRIAKKGVNNGRHRREIELVLIQEIDTLATTLSYNKVSYCAFRTLLKFNSDAQA